MKWVAFLWLCFSCMTVRCSVDGRIETIIGINTVPNFPRCGHVICDRHAVFDPHGRARCPIDGSLAR